MTAVGTVIAGRYRLVDQLAVGGMGSVWRAWDELLERPVAVKQLLTQAGLSHDDTDTARLRIIREARITARLHHPNAVTLYDVVEHDGHPCLIMQYVPSKSLSTLIRESGPVDIRFATRTGAELASALATAHRVGVVHRDVKPGNVLITEDGSARLTDFGISHAVGDVTLTSTGVLTGTPAFLAPEVARGEQSGFPADVFSLGATLYASLEGFPPFGTDPNPMAVLHRVASGKMLPPQRTGPLTPLITRMLSTEPSARPTMTEVGATLNGRLTQEPERSDTQSRSTFALTVREEADGQALREQPPPYQSPQLPPPASHQPSERSAPPAPAARTLATPLPMLPADDPAPSNGTGSGPPAPPVFPAARDDAPGRRRRIAVVAGTVAALVVLIAAVALLLNRPGDNPTAAGDPETGSASSSIGPAPTSAAGRTSPAPSTPAAAPAASAAPSATAPSPAASSPAPATTTSGRTAAAAQPATTKPEDSSRESSSSAAPAAGSGGGNGQGQDAPNAGRLAAAITDYYAVMPRDTDQGWSRLTANFQNGIAQNRDYYESFWDGIERVTAEDVTASPPGTAEATITYFFKDGRVSTERTVYSLVEQDGTIKIDNSSVVG
jgi:serine/threonine protein kinase